MKNKSKKALLGFGGLLAALSIYVMAATRQDIEIPRRLGLFKDIYAELSEEEIRSKINSPEDARDYLLRHLRYSSGSASSLSGIHEFKMANCEGAALAVKELLGDNSERYGVQRVMLERAGTELYHVFAVVRDKDTKRYCRLGIRAADCSEFKYDSLEEAVKAEKKTLFGLFDNSTLIKEEL